MRPLCQHDPVGSLEGSEDDGVFPAVAEFRLHRERYAVDTVFLTRDEHMARRLLELLASALCGKTRMPKTPKLPMPVCESVQRLALSATMSWVVRSMNTTGIGC